MLKKCVFFIFAISGSIAFLAFFSMFSAEEEHYTVLEMDLVVIIHFRYMRQPNVITPQIVGYS